MFNLKELMENLPANCLMEKVLIYAEGCTDASDEFLIMSTLAAMATTVGSNVWIAFGATLLYPNLYIIKLGESSRIRKTTTDRYATQFLNEVCKDRVFPNDITPERFVAKMQDTSSCLLRFTEIGGSFKKMEHTRYMSGFKQMLTELYDNDTYHKELKGNRKDGEVNIVELPCVSILGSSTFEWFQQGITMDDIASGLLPRFLFCVIKKPTKEKLYFPKKVDPILKESIVEDYKMLMELWKGEKKLSEEAMEAYVTWCKSTEEAYDKDPSLEKVASFYDRTEKSVLKIALLTEGMLQVMKKDKFVNTDEVSLLAMEIAIQLGTYFQQTVKELILEELKLSPFESDMKRIINALKRKNGDCTNREIMQATKIYSRDLRTLLDVMEELELIEQYDHKTSGGGSYRVRLLGGVKDKAGEKVSIKTQDKHTNKKSAELFPVQKSPDWDSLEDSTETDERTEGTSATKRTSKDVEM